MPDREPANTAPALRAAFVGQSVFFEHCSLQAPAGGVEPCFLDFRAGAPVQPLLARLHELDPDVVLVFRPEIVPARAFDGLRAHTIGYLTEPLPRSAEDGHPDLRERLRWLREVDPGNFDRIVSFDPLIAQTASDVLAVWRSLPIPVADELFMDVRERGRPPALLFVGRSTEHREQLLASVKGRHRIVHIGHGLFGERLQRFLRSADVQLNLHNNPYPSFENRVCIALAAGHLMLSEQLSPRHELEPGRDYLEFEDGEQLARLIGELRSDPDAYLDVQRAGREKAEGFRASRVFPRLLREALQDIESSGSVRRR